MSDTATGDTGSDAPVLIERDGSIETWTINLPDDAIRSPGGTTWSTPSRPRRIG